MAAADDHVPPAAGICANCFARLPARQRFCGDCGQEARLHAPTLREFAHEYASHYVALDGGVLWRSLGLLLFRPGQLALEYFRGRRRRHVGPLRLYLTASILFFVFLRLTGVSVDTQAPPEPAAENRLDLRAAAFGEDWGLLDRLRVRLTRRVGELEAEVSAGQGPQVVQRVVRSFIASLYYAMFLLLPLYAALVALVYRDQRRTYGEHLVYGLYSHAAMFLLLLAILLIPVPWLQLALFCWLMSYPYLELARLYPASSWRTFWRANVISVLYLAVSLPVMLGFFALALLG